MGKKKSKEGSKGSKSLALFAQPFPKSDDPDVWPLVIKDMEDRNHLGKVKYGIPLRTHNGRNALVDAYQEVLDLSVYLRQEIEERKFLEEALDSARKVPGFEKAEACSIGKVIDSLTRYASESRERARVLDATLIHYRTQPAYTAGFDDGVEKSLAVLEEVLGQKLDNDQITKLYTALELKKTEEKSDA